MEPFPDQLLFAWRMHESKTAALLKAVKQSGLEASLSTRGGRTVGQQLVHMHTVRVDLLSKMRRDLACIIYETRGSGRTAAPISASLVIVVEL